MSDLGASMEREQTERSRDLRRRAFSATWLSYAAFYLCRANFAVLIPLLVRDEGFTKLQLARAVLVYSLCYVVGQVTSGLLSDRIGARRVVTGGMLLSASITVLLGFSHSLSMIILCQGINGYAQACGWPGLLKMMAAVLDSRSRGLTMGWWTTNYVVGPFVATVFATWAATGPFIVALGWRRGAWWPAAVLATLAVVFVFLSRNLPSGNSTPVSTFAGLREVTRNRAVDAIAAMYFTLKLVRYVFLFWLPLYMTQRLGYPPSKAGYTSSIFDLTGFIGAVLAGYVSDRFTRGRRFPVGVIMMVILGGLCLVHPTLASTGYWGNVTGIALIGIMVFGADTLMTGVAVQDAVRREVTATAGGFTNAVGSAGAVLSPIIAAGMATRYGWDTVFYLLGPVAAVGGAILATQWNERKDAG